jgi:hypothetical protein
LWWEFGDALKTGLWREHLRYSSPACTASRAKMSHTTLSQPSRRVVDAWMVTCRTWAGRRPWPTVFPVPATADFGEALIEVGGRRWWRERRFK